MVLCLGHLGGMIQEFVGDGRAFGLEVEYSWDGERPLGTAGAVRAALPLLGDALARGFPAPPPPPRWPSWATR